MSLELSFRKAALIFIAIISFSVVYSQTGTWSLVTNTAPDYNMGVMLLLTDGTVIAHDTTGEIVGTGWDKLTPDNTGSYINGTWSRIASMKYDRLFFPSQVLPNGKVFVAGGEYGSGDTAGEVYDPAADTWTRTGAVTNGDNIYDGNSEILPNGTVLVGPQIGTNPSYDNLFYSPVSNLWSSAAFCPLSHDEAAWLKLPDSSILFVGISNTNTCRYIPASNTWIADGIVPVQLYDVYGSESGAAILLPNGKAIFFGATGHNAIYTPSGNHTPGTWTAAADFPKIGGIQTGTVDAPAAMMPNGRILCAASPIGTSANEEFQNPTYFFEYDYTTNTFAQVTSVFPSIGVDSLPGISCYQTTMLVLPNGTILLGINQSNISNNYWIYTPAGSPIATGKPTINKIYKTACGTNYYITGKLFNGISEGAGFGDDWQMETNYPLVRLTNGTNTYYAKTTNWNRIGAVQTDSLEDTAQFALPAVLPVGTYSLVVVANGFASNPTLFSTYHVSTDTTISSCITNNGTATATPIGGTGNYTYFWAPGGSTQSIITGLSAFTYTVTVKDSLGCSTSATAIVTNGNLAVSTSVNPVTCRGDSTGSATAIPGAGQTPYTYSWASSGGNAIMATGLSVGVYTITLTDANGCVATASANITQPATLTVSSGSHAAYVHSCNGEAWVTPSGGNSPYTYSWSPGGGMTDTIKALCIGNYCCKVTDKKGCLDSACVDVITGIPAISHSSSVKIFPDPNTGYFTISGLSKGLLIELYNYTGQNVISTIAEDATTHFNISNLPNGIYLVRVLSITGDIILQSKIVKTN